PRSPPRPDGPARGRLAGARRRAGKGSCPNVLRSRIPSVPSVDEQLGLIPAGGTLCRPPRLPLGCCGSTAHESCPRLAPASPRGRLGLRARASLWHRFRSSEGADNGEDERDEEEKEEPTVDRCPAGDG